VIKLQAISVALIAKNAGLFPLFAKKLTDIVGPVFLLGAGTIL